MRRTLNKLATFAKLVTSILPRLPSARLTIPSASSTRLLHSYQAIPSKTSRLPQAKSRYAKTTTNPSYDSSDGIYFYGVRLVLFYYKTYTFYRKCFHI